jgi:hypothetical protein
VRGPTDGTCQAQHLIQSHEGSSYLCLLLVVLCWNRILDLILAPPTLASRQSAPAEALSFSNAACGFLQCQWLDFKEISPHSFLQGHLDLESTNINEPKGHQNPKVLHLYSIHVAATDVTQSSKRPLKILQAQSNSWASFGVSSLVLRFSQHSKRTEVSQALSFGWNLFHLLALQRTMGLFTLLNH